jgi:hypothetical protein
MFSWPWAAARRFVVPFEREVEPSVTASQEFEPEMSEPSSSRETTGSHLITADRSEKKFLLPPDGLREWIALFQKELPSHRFRGEGANLLLNAKSYVTTIYFDTPSRDLFRLARSERESVKLRAKEYYDVHPGLAEVATDPTQLVRFRPTIWLELKHKDGERTGKRRLAVPKRDAPAFFVGGTVSPAMARYQRKLYKGESDEVLAEVAAFVARFREPMRPDCVVNYRRIAWQDGEGSLRLTLDLGLSFFRPPEDLWSRHTALTRESLGDAVGVAAGAVLEVKSRKALPPWLASRLPAAGHDEGFSKFVAASSAVHGG